MVARLDNDQLAWDKWWSHLRSSIASKAVQIWMRSAFSLVPTKLLIFRFCLRALKNSSISPAIFVDVGDGGSPEAEVIGQQHDLALIRLIPDHPPAPLVLKGLPSLLAGKADD